MIGTKSRRPCRLPFNSASRRALGTAPISAAARVTKLPHSSSSTSHTTRPTQPSFLGRRFLCRVAAPLLELIVTTSPAHPLRQVTLRSHHEQRLHSGLAWGSRSHGFVEFYDTIYGIFSALAREFVFPVLAHSTIIMLSPGAGQAWCRCPSDHPWEVAICMRPRGRSTAVDSKYSKGPGTSTSPSKHCRAGFATVY